MKRKAILVLFSVLIAIFALSPASAQRQRRYDDRPRRVDQNRRYDRYDDRYRDRRYDRSRPRVIFDNRPRGRYEPYVYRRYPGHYSRPSIFVVLRIPSLIFNRPDYYGCRYEFRDFINLSGYPARVLISQWPYDTVRYIYPGDGATIQVPIGRFRDVEATVLIGGIWRRADIYSGYGSDLIIR